MLSNLIVITLFSINSLIIKTDFKNKNDILDQLLEPKFFNKLINIIDADEYHFNQDLKQNKKINLPLSISFKKKPFLKTCSLFPYPKLIINQTWFVKNDIIFIDIQNRFLCISTQISLIKNNNSIYLDINSNFKKYIYIPQKFITQVLNDINSMIPKLLDYNK